MESATSCGGMRIQCGPCQLDQSSVSDRLQLTDGETWTFDTPFYWWQHLTGSLTGAPRLIGHVGPSKRIWLWRRTRPRNPRCPCRRSADASKPVALVIPLDSTIGWASTRRCDARHSSATGRWVSDRCAWRFGQGCEGPVRRRHERRRRSPADPAERACDASPIDAWPPSQSAARRQERAALWWRASCSRRPERNVDELGGRFPVFEAFGNDAQRKGLDAGHRFITILPVAQNTGQGGNLGDPATVFFEFEVDREGHARNVPSPPSIHQLSLPWSPSPKQLGEPRGEQASARGVPPTGPVFRLADAARLGGIDPPDRAVTEIASGSCRGQRTGGALCRPRTGRR